MGQARYSSRAAPSRMGKSTRVCLRMLENEGLALPAIVVVYGTTFVLEAWLFLIGSGSTVRPHEWLLNCWLLLALGASYSVWAFFRARGTVGPAAGQWFVLAAYGVWMRTYCFSVVFGMAETFGDRSIVEEFAGRHGKVLIGVHRYGGPFAFALGLAMVAWCSRPISPRRDRAGAPSSRRRHPAAAEGRAPPGDGLPS